MKRAGITVAACAAAAAAAAPIAVAADRLTQADAERYADRAAAQIAKDLSHEYAASGCRRQSRTAFRCPSVAWSDGHADTCEFVLTVRRVRGRIQSSRGSIRCT